MRRVLFLGSFLAALVAAVACGGSDDSRSAATPEPTPVSTAAPTQSPALPTVLPAVGIVYEVAPGDTLSSIALRFDTTVEALVAANDIADPDLIHPGQELIIPDGQIEATPTPG